jgi:predicted glycosyltransferase
MRSLRVVCYAVNGSGAGHLMRLVAVCRWLRRYARHARARAEIYFLTSSEADGLLFHERFASFKLPSKTVVDDTGIDKLAYLALAKQWVWHSLGLLRPDLLVVDSFPRGSFGELLSALDLARRRAFIYRPVKDDVAARADFQAMLPLYDAILVPERAEDAPVRVPPNVGARLRHLGPVMARERGEMLPRAEARARLGVPGDRLAVYVSSGGGGDAGAERQLHEVAAALADDPGLHLCVGAGPLYRGRPGVGERVTWLGGQPAAELMLGMYVAVCAAGYNTWN